MKRSSISAPMLIAVLSLACACAVPLCALADEAPELTVPGTQLGDSTADSASDPTADPTAGESPKPDTGDPESTENSGNAANPNENAESSGNAAGPDAGAAGETAQEGQQAPYEWPVSVKYRVKMKGASSWKSWKRGYATAGSASAKAAKPICNFKIALEGGTVGDNIYYSERTTSGTYKNTKWNGAAAGKSNNIEAISVALTGPIAQKYSVRYRVYVQGQGWTRRTYDGDWAGTYGRKLRIQAIQVDLVEHGSVSGWSGSGTDWSYYDKGVRLASQWVRTKESPIETTSKKMRYYWIDANGELAVNRMVNPDKARDEKAGRKAFALKDGWVLCSESAWVGGKWYTAKSNGKLYISKKKKVKTVGKYVKWAVKIAKNDSHGYSQAVRWGPDYDCSSLVISAVRAAGVRTGSANWTGDMRSELCRHGFTWHTDLSKLKAGDILLAHNPYRQHTEIYLGNGKLVGARGSENGGIYGQLGDQTGREISVASYFDADWDGFLRYK